jgi:single-strand DNA-binding protein
MHKITLIGHLGRDPEMRYTPTGQAVTSFSVASSYGQGDKKQTEWFNVSAWEKQAELCNQYLQKGSEVYIEGRIKARCYEGRDGWQASLDVTVTNVQFLGSAQRSDTSETKATNAPGPSRVGKINPGSDPTAPNSVEQSPLMDGPDADSMAAH